jgi:putative FmdB family regulatory protein
MPIYEYKCLDCGFKFEHLYRSASERVACPKCKHPDLQKLVSAFAFNAKDKNGNITASPSGCSGCTSQNCATCAG